MEPGHIFRTKLPFHRNQSQERRVTQARLTFPENPWGLPFFQFTLRRAHASKREFEKKSSRSKTQNSESTILGTDFVCIGSLFAVSGYRHG